MNHWKSTLAVIGIGQLISILTSTIVGFSIIFWISNEFKSPTALSLAILAGFLPQFVLGLFAGVYVERKRCFIRTCSSRSVPYVFLL